MCTGTEDGIDHADLVELFQTMSGFVKETRNNLDSEGMTPEMEAQLADYMGNLQCVAELSEM